MALDIQLGYPMIDSERASAISGSNKTTSMDLQEQRTMDWITHVSSEHDAPSNNVASIELTGDKKLQVWDALPVEILRGPPARFKAYNGRWKELTQYGLKNNLMVAVGFLELANACDFPANIWNQTPVPSFAAVLMGIGGFIGIALLYCSIFDLQLSATNLRLLRTERSRLYRLLRRSTTESGTRNQGKSIEACLAVNTLELGFELVDRFLMNLIMGFGCLLVGVGTWMAIDGSDSRIFMASNLLTGYIGNTPAAFYGLINVLWSAYVWYRANTHSRLACTDVAVNLIWPRLSHRYDTIKLHAMVYGLTSFVAGGAALMTATLWYGYIILVPCVCASAWCNWLWRNKCGYGRPIFEEAPVLGKDILVTEIQAILLLQRTVKREDDDSLYELQNLPYLLEVIQRYDLMGFVCLELWKRESLKEVLFGGTVSGEKTIEIHDILRLDTGARIEVSQVLKEFARRKGHKNLMIRALVHRERYLLELLGAWYYCLDKVSTRVWPRNG